MMPNPLPSTIALPPLGPQGHVPPTLGRREALTGIRKGDLIGLMVEQEFRKLRHARGTSYRMTRILRNMCSCYMLGDAAHTKRLVRMLSAGWLLLYCGLILFGVLFWGGGLRELVKLPCPKPLVLAPVCYFIFGFCTSFAKRRNWALLLAGVFIHILLASFVVQNASELILGPIFILAGLYIAAACFWMFSKLEVPHAA
jgi:hypothetical protein